MALGKAMSNLKFDKRMEAFNLRTGKVSADELKQYNDSLQDVEGQSVSLNLDSKSEAVAEPAAQPETPQTPTFN